MITFFNGVVRFLKQTRGGEKSELYRPMIYRTLHHRVQHRVSFLDPFDHHRPRRNLLNRKLSTMFFARAPSTLLARSSALRSKFSSAGAEEAAASGGLLAGAVATTFGTYCLADFLSNFIQHPTQKVSFARGGGLSIPSTIVWMYSIRTS